MELDLTENNRDTKRSTHMGLTQSKREDLRVSLM